VKTNYSLWLFLFVFMLFAHKADAQDVHFSQHFHAPIYTNASFNGLSPGMSRFSLNSKHQWYSVNSPFQTYLVAFDNSWKYKKTVPSFFSTSALLYYDVAGDADFSTTLFSPSLSYTFVLNRTFSSMLSVGIQPGIAQRSLDITKLRFDSQFDGYVFDPNLPTNEIVDNQTFMFGDIGAGIHYINFFNLNTYAGGGFFVSHLNRPIVSMKNSDEVRLDVKYTIHGEARTYIKSTVVLPTFYFAKQGPHNELLIGARAVINRVKVSAMENNILFRKNFLLGLYYRGNDALIFYSGMEFQNYNIGISYDVNVSRLIPASQARGGFEISAAYIWQKSKKYGNKDIPCPIF